MTSRQDWPKPDLLQQRRLELGLPLDPAPALPLFPLVLKGVAGAVALVMLVLLVLLGLHHRQKVVQVEVDALHPVEQRVGDAKARLRSMNSRRSTLEQQTQSIAEQLWRYVRDPHCWRNCDRSRLRACALCRSTPIPPSC